MGAMRIRVVWAGPSAPLVSTHVALDLDAGTITGTDAHDFHVAVATFWNSVRTVIVNDLSYVVVPVVDVIDNDGNITGRVSASNTAAAAGTVTTEASPYQTQGLVSWSTGSFVEGREIVGRTFIPGVPEAFSNDSAPDSSWITTVQNAANAYVGTTTCHVAVLSRQHHQITSIIGATARNQWKVLRSRR